MKLVHLITLCLSLLFGGAAPAETFSDLHFEMPRGYLITIRMRENSKLSLISSQKEYPLKKSFLSDTLKAQTEQGEYSVKLPKDLNSISYSFKNRNFRYDGDGQWHSGVRVIESKNCHTFYGNEYCPGDYFIRQTDGNPDAYWTMQMKMILLDIKGNVASLLTSQTTRPEKVSFMEKAEPILKNFECIGNSCVGDTVFVGAIMVPDLIDCKARLIGMTRRGFLVENERVNSDSMFKCRGFGLDLVNVLTDMSREERLPFSKLVPKSCDDLSKNQKREIFVEESKPVLASCLKSGYHVCEPGFYDIIAESDKTCRISGAVRGYYTHEL